MITPRDVLLLRALAETGGLTGTHLATLLDMSPEMVRRRCRLLKAAALALVSVQASSPQLPNIYLLGPRAPAHLARVLGKPATDFVVPKQPIPWGQHHELVLALYIAFHIALSKSKEWRMDLFEFEPAIRKRVGDQGGIMIPDSIVVLERHDGVKVAAALEADSGAENPSYLAERKQMEFSRARERGGKLRGVEHWCVLWISPDVHRRNRIAKAAWAAGCAPGLHYFLALPELDPRTVLAEAWWTPRPYEAGARLVRESPFQTVAPPVVTGVAAEGSDDRSVRCNGQFADMAGSMEIVESDATRRFTSRERA